MQKLGAIAKHHAVVFLYQHRRGQYRQLVEAVARMTLEVGAVEPVLDYYLDRPSLQQQPVTWPVQVASGARTTLGHT